MFLIKSMFFELGKKMNLNIFIIPFSGGTISPQAFETFAEACPLADGLIRSGALAPQRLGDYLNAAALNGTHARVKIEFSHLNKYASEHLVACKDYVLNEWMT